MNKCISKNKFIALFIFSFLIGLLGKDSLAAANSNTWRDGSTPPLPISTHSMVGIDDEIYLIGGYNPQKIRADVDVYNINTGLWSKKASMNIPRERSYAGLLDGKIYSVGGKNDNGLYENSIEVYDPQTNTWTLKEPAPTARDMISGAVLNGEIYIIGGRNDSQYLSTVEKYNPNTNTWTTVAPLNTPRREASTVTYNGKIYLIGGYDSYIYLDSVEIYDPATNTWSMGPKLPYPIYGMTSHVIDDKIYVIGGACEYTPGGTITRSTKIYAFEPSLNEWIERASMTKERSHHSSAFLNGEVYVIGGYDGFDFLDASEIYTPSTKEEFATEFVVKAEMTNTNEDIDRARKVVSNLNESSNKTTLNKRLDALRPKQSSNIDVYIRPQSILSLSMNTNTISFDDFDTVEDYEIINAFDLTVTSNLTYDIDAILATSISNKDKTLTLDNDTIEIKEGNALTYTAFRDVGVPVNIVTNHTPTENKVFGIDLKLRGDKITIVDTYKSVLRFEVTQN